MHVCRPLHCKTIKFDIVLSGCFSNKTVRIELHSNMPSIANTLLIPIIDSLLQISWAKILADLWWLQSLLGLYSRAWELPQYVLQLNDIAESNVSTAVTSCSKQITKWLISKFYWFIVSEAVGQSEQQFDPEFGAIKLGRTASARVLFSTHHSAFNKSMRAVVVCWLHLTLTENLSVDCDFRPELNKLLRLNLVINASTSEKSIKLILSHVPWRSVAAIDRLAFNIRSPCYFIHHLIFCNFKLKFSLRRNEN